MRLARAGVVLELMGTFESEELLQRCRKHPAWTRTRYHGQVERAVAVGVLGRCAAGLVTFLPESNHVEAEPNKLFEYMAAGLPVIASDFPAWRELLDGVDCALFVDPTDPRDIARAIDWVVEHPEEAEDMGRRGRKAIEERFNWEAEGKKLVGLYEELLDS
jgi:glycosyltransferase involved in cell wall biosynthesis